MKSLLIVLFFNLLTIVISGQIKSDSVFSESEIILKTTTGSINGTLTIPHSTTTSPIVLIIPGSGPTDRNGNAGMALQTNTYKMLSEGMAKRGISSVRFDKRGIGKSKSATTSEVNLRFETYINDLVAWISMLRTDKRFSNVYILGHSEGSLIGIMAALQSNIAGFISISGAGKSADKILQEQLKTKLPMQLLQESNKILDSLKMGKIVSAINPNLNALYRPSVQPYLISWMKYDPAIEIKKLKIPILIIQGSTDLQVMVEDAKLLSASNPGSKLIIIENMNHVLKECDAEVQKNLATYRNPELPLKSGLVDTIAEFILKKKLK